MPLLSPSSFTSSCREPNDTANGEHLWEGRRVVQEREDSQLRVSTEGTVKMANGSDPDDRDDQR